MLGWKFFKWRKETIREDVSTNVRENIREAKIYICSDGEEFKNYEEAFTHEKKILLCKKYSHEGCNFNTMISRLVNDSEKVIEILVQKAKI